MTPTKITVLNRLTLRAIEADLAAAYATIAAKHGVAITPAGGSFSPEAATLKLKIAVVGDDGVAVRPEAEVFRQLAPAYGFVPTDLGRELTLDGRRYAIAGLKPRSKKPVLLRDLGTPNRFVVSSPDYVKFLLGRAA